MGRQTMDLGGRRLVARNRFRDTIQNYTGATLNLKYQNTKLTTFFVLPIAVLPGNLDRDGLLHNRIKYDRESWALRFFGIDLEQSKAFADVLLQGYFYALHENDAPDRPTSNRHIYTEGLRAFRKPAPGHLDGELEATVQVGTRLASVLADESKRRRVFAGFTHFEFGYTWDSPFQPRLSAELDYASGENPAKSSRYSRFDSLFGPRRAEFGPTGIYGILGRENIVSEGARLILVPHPRVDGFVSYRANWLANRSDFFARSFVVDRSGKSGSFAGHQIEMRIRTWIVPNNIRWEVGGAVFLNGRFMRVAPNATGYGSPLFGYTDLSFEF